MNMQRLERIHNFWQKGYLYKQSIGQSLGVVIDRTPKCHCEVAGECIEFSWGWQRIITEKYYWKIKEVKKSSWKALDNVFHET